jgi:uncharacterized protein YjbJ (UPF0337 family)
MMSPLWANRCAFCVVSLSTGVDMNWDTIEGNWKEAKGKIREQWGKLTDDDLDVVAGKRDQLVGVLQQKYGKTKDEVEQELSDYEARDTDSVAYHNDQHKN